MSVNEKLLRVQTELVAPKGQWNDFSKFKYRSCEDILEAVKPLLKDVKAALTISDEIQQIGDRYYVVAVARFIDVEDVTSVSVTAYAREELSKKGMDASQITGSASSYARKYALNGLFAIDDGKDADTRNNKAEPKQKEEPSLDNLNNKIKQPKANTLQNEVKRLGMTDEQFLTKYKKSGYTDFTEQEWLKLYPALQKIK